MSDTRRKNVDWKLNILDERKGSVSTDDAHLAVLMDIRDELQSLNAVFHCINFQQVPQILRDIRRNTKKPAKRKLKIVRRTA